MEQKQSMEEKQHAGASRHGTTVLAGLLATLLLVAPASVKAEERARDGGAVDIRDRTTRSLEAACLAEQGAASGWCSAYLMGVADTLSAFGNGGNRGGLCRADYAIEQLSETFLTWTRANEALHEADMLAGASLALRQKWPCR